MTTQSSSFDAASLASTAPTTRLSGKWRMVEPLLKRLHGGTLRLRLADGGTLQYGAGLPAATITIHNEHFIGKVMRSGDIGFAQAYIDGDWTTDDLPSLLGLLAANRREIETLVYGSWLGRFLYRLRHVLNRNSKAGSRRNIHAHYDIGNDFYRLWLDASMTYSSALYADDGQDLIAAQQAKYRRIAKELELRAGQHVLEIGCGWGGFAEMAAGRYGACITGLTLSTEQLAYAQARMENAGMAEQANFKLQDYRDTNGQYDAIASIEMFEAVGEEYWPAYFDCVARNLKTDGRACIQTIVIQDALFERYRRGTDFIQQYIFPGGMLPSPARFRALAEQHGLRVTNELAFGKDYARTLRAWRDAFHHELAHVRAQGFDDRFIRTWDFYLAYCEAGFAVGDIDVMQFTLQK